ncbi:hypothetical protein HYV43_01665 [Candidatus Micrarchaeota archaeon]|nr:hypothetical protein [Candidatus Micrarchaeota archaeon]
MGRIYFKLDARTRRLLEREAKRRYGRSKGFMVKTASEIFLWYIRRLEEQKREARRAERVKRNFEKQIASWRSEQSKAATMLENGITTIYTENVEDFEKIPGIKAVNPFD